MSSIHVSREITAMRAAGHVVSVWDVSELPPRWEGLNDETGGAFPLASLRVFLTLISRPVYALRLSRILADALQHLPRPDCVMAAGAGLAAVYGDILSRLWKVPFFANVYGPDVFRPWEGGIEALCRTKRVFAPCELVRSRADMLMRGSDQGPIVMPEGVPEAFFAVERSESLAMTLLFVGRIVRKKGLHVLLDALPDIRMRIPEIQLRILGDGPLRPDFERFVQDNGLDDHVTFLGEVDEAIIIKELSRARAICIPSVPSDDGDVDGVPLVLLEAMASGCPVITSDVGGIPEVMTDFQTGRMLPAGDVAALSETVPSVMLASASAARCAEVAREFAREHFLLRGVIEEKMLFIEKALADGAR